MKTYQVKEIFWSLQGEGRHAMRSIVFVRFAGCNLWTGHDSNRIRDSKRHGADCPLWCDTDFVGGEKLSAFAIKKQAQNLGADKEVPVVLTGGEPLLQLDIALCNEFHDSGIRVHVETNGTLNPDGVIMEQIDWLTVSPKVAPEKLKLSWCNELKVVIPSYDPLSLLGVISAECNYVQPEYGPRLQENIDECIKFVKENPKWRLSLQAHKLIHLP